MLLFALVRPIECRGSTLQRETGKWVFNDTDVLPGRTDAALQIGNVQSSDSGSYTVLVTDRAGRVTNSTAMLNVIEPVDRRPVAGLTITAEPASTLTLQYNDSIATGTSWLDLDNMSVTSSPQPYFDLTTPLQPHRFYRLYQSSSSNSAPVLGMLGMVPALTLTGAIGDTVRVDGIYAVGPTDAWFTLTTVTLTNAQQYYFDVSASGRAARLYRLTTMP